jgi:hypothetical protein
MIQEVETHTNTYNVLKRIEDAGLFDDAVKNDIIPLTLAFHKLVYEMYLIEKGIRDPYDAIRQTALKNDVSNRMVYYIIKKMEG